MNHKVVPLRINLASVFSRRSEDKGRSTTPKTPRAKKSSIPAYLRAASSQYPEFASKYIGSSRKIDSISPNGICFGSTTLWVIGKGTELNDSQFEKIRVLQNIHLFDFTHQKNYINKQFLQKQFGLVEKRSSLFSVNRQEGTTFGAQLQDQALSKPDVPSIFMVSLFGGEFSHGFGIKFTDKTEKSATKMVLYDISLKEEIVVDNPRLFSAVLDKYLEFMEGQLRCAFPQFQLIWFPDTDK
ncbi:MAG: hypothetical protein ACI9BD_000426 [Candidatus Marinamargulisbacteria bacterium]|jgi:hypothetical protein